MLSKSILGMILGILMVVADGSSAHADECSQAALASGQCPTVITEVGEGGVSIRLSTGTPGTPGDTQTSQPPPSGSPGSPGSSWTPPPPRAPVLGTSECEVIISGYCRATSPPKNPPSPPVVEVTPPTAPTRASDLANFSPGSPQIALEPEGWSLPGLPTNIFARAGQSVEAGELLGWPIEVRFSPSTYSWGYGDGSTNRASRAGNSWGGEQFLPTATSYVYDRPGSYRVTLQVGYELAYRFEQGPFIAIPGLVWRGAGERVVQVLSVTPLLVDQGCSVGSLVGGRC